MNHLTPANIFENECAYTAHCYVACRIKCGANFNYSRRWPDKLIYRSPSRSQLVATLAFSFHGPAWRRTYF